MGREEEKNNERSFEAHFKSRHKTCTIMINQKKKQKTYDFISKQKDH